MADFEKTLQEFEALRKKRGKAAERLRNANTALLLKATEIEKLLIPCWQAAVETYNATAGLKIVLTSIRPAISSEGRRLRLEARLAYSSGMEPNEELDSAEVQAINDAFGPTLNRELARAGISLTFTAIKVPTDYYTM